MRAPDAVDAARVLAFVLLAIAGAALMVSQGGAPAPIVTVLMQVAFAAVPLLYGKASGLGAFAGSGFHRLPLRTVGLVLLASLGSFWLLNGVVQLQAWLFQWAGLGAEAQLREEQIRQGIEQARKGGAVQALSLLVLIPPFCEETFFRGLVFRGLTKRFGVWAAILSTALLFAALHDALVQGLLMVLLGCFFATLVYLTGSLWSSVIAHAVNNLAVLTLMWVYGGMLPEIRGPWWIYLFSAGIFALAFVLLVQERNAKLEARNS